MRRSRLHFLLSLPLSVAGVARVPLRRALAPSSASQLVWRALALLSAAAGSPALPATSYSDYFRLSLASLIAELVLRSKVFVRGVPVRWED